MSKKNLELNIVIIPSAAAVKKALPVSRELKKRGGTFALDRKSHFAHITIQQVHIPKAYLPTIKDGLAKLAGKLKPFRVTSTEYYHYPAGWTGITYKRDRKIRSLQSKILDLVKPIRSDKPGQGIYHPHITFTKFDNGEINVLAGINKYDFSFQAREIALYYLGPNGTCRKLIKKYKMKG